MRKLELSAMRMDFISAQERLMAPKDYRRYRLKKWLKGLFGSCLC